ncbi:MAG: hypothetical protein CBE41_04270 [Gammaproteobacteria bacterium TMED281]|nr:MAG: hypothetical protein CBE41_04270 [Gammaproteobacteria bacterium TMED281]
MKSFSPIENLLAKFLSRFPHLKKRIKFFYQSINYFFHKKDYLFYSEYDVEDVTDNYLETFFGYYDKDPYNQSKKLILFHGIDNIKNNKKVKVVCMNQDTKEIKQEFSSKAFNYQQGARLHWLTEEKFIFNDFNEDIETYCAKIFDVSTNELREISLPVYDTFKDEFAMTLNFERLAKFSSDYGYFARKKLDFYEDNVKDGIWKINIENDAHELFISFEEIIQFHYEKRFLNANHTVNHIMLSHDGEKFIFIHRWYENDVRRDRLILVDIKSKRMKMICSKGVISHCCWVNNNKILGYLESNLGLGYQFYEIADDKFEMIDSNLNKYGDGHPTYFKNYMLTDTYPNRSRNQSLLKYNFKTKKIEVLGEFFSGLQFIEEKRCDLHPRISSNCYFFDSTFKGMRRFYSLKIQDNE